jgi:hypothetical protein
MQKDCRWIHLTMAFATGDGNHQLFVTKISAIGVHRRFRPLRIARSKCSIPPTRVFAQSSQRGVNLPKSPLFVTLRIHFAPLNERFNIEDRLFL